jgi:hypothetical protein
MALTGLWAGKWFRLFFQSEEINEKVLEKIFAGGSTCHNDGRIRDG